MKFLKWFFIKSPYNPFKRLWYKIRGVHICETPVHDEFGLSYANYLVYPRCVLEAMPVQWQYRFVNLFRELEDTIDTEKCVGDYMVKLRGDGGKFEYDPFAAYRRPPKVPLRSKS